MQPFLFNTQWSTEKRGSGCIGRFWNPSQPQAVMVNKLSRGLEMETTHWRTPFFSTVGEWQSEKTRPATALNYDLRNVRRGDHRVME